MDLIKAVLDGQAGLDDCKEAMSEAVRGIMVKALVDQMKEEAAALYRPHYHPAPEAAHRRVGRASGQFRLNGAEARFARPRVRRKQGRGRGEELIALHLLEAPSTLQVSLLSTHAVENPIRNFRAKTRRVTRWRPQSDMSERWTAYAMLTVEQGFHRIYGYQDLPVLLRALGWREENMARATSPVTPDPNRGDGTSHKDH